MSERRKRDGRSLRITKRLACWRSCVQSLFGARSAASVRGVRQILEGERRIAVQREIVAELERSGQPSFDATELLRRLEHLQTRQIANRDRLRKELGLPGG